MGTQQFSGKLAMQLEARVNAALGHAFADTHDRQAQNRTENVGPPWYSAQRLCTQHNHPSPMVTSACTLHTAQPPIRHADSEVGHLHAHVCTARARVPSPSANTDTTGPLSFSQ